MKHSSVIPGKVRYAGIIALFLFAIFSAACVSTDSIKEVSRLHASGKLAAANEMLLVLAKSGNVAAQAWLGANYASGKDIEQDFKKSFYWQLKAAEQGHIIAQYNVAVLYARGRGAVKNNKHAVYWFRKAADAGMPQAQLHMGLMREKGWGVSRCPYTASKWYYRAGQTFIDHRNLKMARHVQQKIQSILPGYYLAQQLKDEIFLDGGNK